MAGMYRPRRIMEIPENTTHGLCVWKLPHGGYIQNSNGDYLNCPGRMYDQTVEKKMRKVAESLGVTEGEPFWLPGFRRVTQSEWEDQMERLLDGKTPDPVDVWRQLNKNEQS